MSEVTDVEHAHEVIGADLLHLTLDLFRDAGGISRDQVTAVDQPLPIEL